MSLKEFYRQTVAITAENGCVFCGTVVDFLYPEDNETDSESIVIKTANGELYEFTQDAMESIRIV